MKVITLTALICLVFISTSAAAPTPEPSNSGSQFEARSQDSQAVQGQSRSSDETGKAVLYTKRSLRHWVAGAAAALGISALKGHKNRNTNNTGNTNSFGSSPTMGNQQQYGGDNASQGSDSYERRSLYSNAPHQKRAMSGDVSSDLSDLD